MYKFVRSNQDMDRVLNWASEGREQGGRYPGMSYEDGLIDMFDWLTGNTDEAPDEVD